MYSSFEDKDNRAFWWFIEVTVIQETLLLYGWRLPKTTNSVSKYETDNVFEDN